MDLQWPSVYGEDSSSLVVSHRRTPVDKRTRELFLLSSRDSWDRVRFGMDV
jgi:hypothetical protein